MMRGTETINYFVNYITSIVVGLFKYLSTQLTKDIGKFMMMITSWIPDWAWKVIFVVLIITGCYMLKIAIKTREDLYKIYP